MIDTQVRVSDIHNFCNTTNYAKSVVYLMDCVEGMKQYPDKYFDLAVVDPPYGIGINSSGRLGHYGGGKKVWDSAPPEEEYFD